MRQLRRMNSINKSPIFSHFAETLSGLSTIRCFNVQNWFINSMEAKINESILFHYPDSVSNRSLFFNLLRSLNFILNV